jgi:hypothetical protein
MYKVRPHGFPFAQIERQSSQFSGVEYQLFNESQGRHWSMGGANQLFLHRNELKAHEKNAHISVGNGGGGHCGDDQFYN